MRACAALFWIGAAGMGGMGAAHALPITLIDDPYATLATADYSVVADTAVGGGFTSDATTGGTITYHVPLSVAILGAPNSSEDIGFDNLRVSFVPEPSSLALFALGLAGLGASRRRRA